MADWIIAYFAGLEAGECVYRRIGLLLCPPLTYQILDMEQSAKLSLKNIERNCKIKWIDLCDMDMTKPSQLCMSVV